MPPDPYQTILFCPPSHVITGGIRHLFHLAEALAAHGKRVAIFEQEGRRPDWFASTTPIIGQGSLHPTPGQTLILPEDQPHILNAIRAWPQRKIVYVQNHVYAAQGVGDEPSYAAYGVSDLICCSAYVAQWMARRHPQCALHVLPCIVDQTLFVPRPKKPIIAYIPRKRFLEAAFIRDMVRHQFSQRRGWRWHGIVNQPHDQVAAILGESAVFLALGRLEGLGLTPLEAMAARCVVAGFTGGGGREYATPQNGFWVEEDDLAACIEAIERACDLAESSPESADSEGYHAATRATLAGYTPEVFRETVAAIWEKLVS